MIREYETINTFNRSPVAAQILTYIIFIGQALTFFICMYINYTHLAKQITILIIYILTMILQIYLAVVTSCSDPSDDVMIQYRNNPKQRRNMNVDDCLYCDICVSYVKQTSRHCKVCQRCVQQFDHHCMWINNCIGSKNYNYFIAMTVVTFLKMIIYIIGMILLWTQDQWLNYFGSMVTIWVFATIVGIFALLIINLIGLHVYLIFRGLTTYQFILLQRQEQRKKKEQQQQAKAKQNNANPSNNIIQLNDRNPIKHQKKQTSQQRIAPVILNQVRQRQQSIKYSHQISGQVIFGMNINELQNKTEKSQQLSQNQNNNNPHDKKAIQNRQNQDEQLSSLNSKGQNRQNISQFFTKNKSLKFFIGDQIGSRPKSSRNDNIKSKQKLFKSVRAVELQNKKQITYESQRKQRNKLSSLEIKQQKSSKKIQVLQYQDQRKIQQFKHNQ